MRAKNSVNRKYDIAKIAILVACFVFVFAATFIVSATANSSLSGIADAATRVTAEHIDDDNGGSVGSAGLTYGNLGRPLEAWDFKFPGVPGGDGKWTYTESLSNVVATTSNFEASGDGGSDAPLWMEVDNPAGLFKSGSNQVGSGRKNNYSVINYNIGGTDSFLAGILNNTMYQLDVTVSCLLTTWANSADNSLSAHTTVQLGLRPSDLTVSSMDWNNVTWSSQSVTGRGSKESTTTASVSLTNLKNGVLSIWGGCQWSGIGTKRDYWMSLSNISIKFTISKANTTYNGSTVKEDGGNPIVATTLPGLATNNVAAQAPYADKITSLGNNKVQYGTQTYDADLTSELSKRLDSIADGSGTMQSYTNKVLGSVTVGGQAVNYYKSLSVEYVDTYNYQTADSLTALLLALGETGSLSQSQVSTVAGAGDKYVSGVSKDANGALSSITWAAGNADYASGIKTVQVGDTVVNVYEIANNSTSAPVKITVDDGDDNTADDTVGVVTVKRTNISRIVVTIYMYRNANVNTIIRDYGSGSCTTSVKFAGIDNVNPIADLSFSTDESNVMFTNSSISAQNSAQWVRTNKLTVNVSSGIGVDESDDEYYSPYVWYYTVAKNNGSAAAIPTGNVYGTYAQLNENLRPIAVNEIDTFVYNFETGTAEGITKGSQISGGSGATGSGYYYFTFYVCDISGNINTARTKSFYVKVDYSTPKSTTTLLTDRSVNITRENNGKWADCGETLSVDLLNNNISGNTLLFDDSVTTHVLVFDGINIISLDGVDLAVNNEYGTVATVHITGIDSEKDVTITTQPNGRGGTLIQFRIDSSEYFAWETYLIMYAGKNYTEGDNPTANVESVTFDSVVFDEDVQGINFGDSIKIYIDNTRPVLPVISDADGKGYLKSVASKDALTTEIGSDRTWFTKSDLMMDTVCEFNDIITDKEFASDLKMYYGVKTIADASSLNSVKTFVTNYLNGSVVFNTDDYKGYFDRTAAITGDNLDGGETDIRIDFIQKDGANMRVLVIWVVDEAGNTSESVQIYYVLADPSKYTVRSQVLANPVVGATASVTQINTDEVATTSFVRGETIIMTLSLEEGYVPYKLTKKAASDTVLLKNTSAVFGWEIPEELEGFITQTAGEGTITLEYKFDELDNLGSLDKSTTFEFSHRKVVSYTITNNSVRYTAKEVVVPISYSDERTDGIYEFAFKYKGGAEMTEVPVIPGNYQVMISIPENHDSFVSSVPASYTDLTITNGIATVKATPTTSFYGETSVSDLRFQVEGIDSDVWEEIKNDPVKVKGSLKLNVTQGTSAYITLPVGKYAVIENVPFEIQYFDVTFEGNYHEIAQKVIEVSILDGEKTYGNPDGMYQFRLELAQFPSSSLATANAVIGFDAKDSDVTYAIYETNTLISREAGENAGVYDFIATSKNFILANENYAVSVIDAGKYTISKRTVTLYVGQQYSYFATKELALAGISSIHPTYSLGADEAYADEIGDGKLALGSQISDFTNITSRYYKQKAEYSIILGTIEETSNLVFVLESPATYTIYIAVDNAVIITPKEGARFESVYGKEIIASNISYSPEYFDVTGAVYGTDFTDITWDASISFGGGATMPNVGAYEVVLSNIQLKKNGDDVTVISEHAVVAVSSQFNFYVIPAVIVVEPIAAVETKVYAENDSVYGIDFEVVSVGGVGKDIGAYAGSMFAYYKNNYVSGSFARAIYDKDGSFIAFGSKNDTVSDNNGVVAGSDNFYSYAVLNQFVSTEPNGNFVVETRINTENTLAISKARINVAHTDFDGVDKVYDGNTNVKYITSKACDLNGKLAVATDDVEISFIATYESFNGAGDNSAVGKKSIIFKSLGLAGAQACNYDLYLDGSLVDAETTFSIFKKLNGTDINIFAGTISLIRSDFTVSKPYDNLTTLNNSSVSIINRTDANNKGTSILYGVKDEMKVLYGVYPDKEVSNNYTVDIELFFPLGEDATEDTIKIEQTDQSIDVSLRTIDGVFGVRVYIQGLGAKITKRVLGYESFSEVAAVDRDYNADSDVTFSYVLASGAVAPGDEAFEHSNAIVIRGKTKNNETNVGTYETEFTGYSIDNTVFAKRYEVDTIALNNYYTGARKLEVTINPAKLMPRVEFSSKVYDGSANTAVTAFDRATADTSQLTTLNYSEKLLSQLKKFSYTFADVTFDYAKNGVLSANVQADEDGNVVLHNVMVTGLVITAESGFEGLLSNYMIYGGRFDTSAGEYAEIGSVTSGATVDPYEMFNVAGLTKRKLQVKANDIDVPDKVYDGTKNATVTASLTTSDAIEEDKEYLEVKATATYARKQVGNNINVTIVITSVDVKAEYKDTYADLINNYDVSVFKLPVQRNILARPVDFSVSFKDRIYDGHETIAKNLIKYDLGSMLGDDANNYSVSTNNGAYYLTKDVEYTEYTLLEEGAAFNSAIDYYQESAGVYSKTDVTAENFADKFAQGLYIKEFTAVEKLGTAYNPILFNSKEKYVNYELSTKSEAPVVGDYFYAYELEDHTIYYGTDILKITVDGEIYNPDVTYYKGTIVTDANGKNQIKLTEKLTSLNESVFHPEEGYYYIPAYVSAVAYYYHMPVAKKYVTKTAYATLDEAGKTAVMQNAIGSYVYDGKAVYLVSEAYSGAVAENIPEEDWVQYIQGKGVITRREVSITSVDINLSASFTKTYDGTTKYYGERGVDYDFSSNSISNDIAEDYIDVETVSAEFKTAQAGMTQVAFVATGIKTQAGKPEASFNYLSAAATSTNKPATVAKRTIYAHLADAEIVYGSQMSSIKSEITYFLDADMTMPVEIKAGSWYVSFEDFISVCGFDMATLEEKYKEQLAQNRYNESYEKDVNGSIYKLAGTFTEPTVSVEVRGAKQNVGYVAEKFALKGGSATNFTFSPLYTDQAAGTSKLTVIARKIYVIADATKTYVRDYGTDLSSDAVKILLLNENGKDGIVSGETSLDVYTGSLKVEFRKVLVSAIGSIASAPAVTAKSLINVTEGNNQGLEEGYYYVAYIVANDFASTNYDVVFGSIVYDDANDKFMYQFAGTSFTSEVPQLTIVLPEIKDVTKSADSKEVTYNRTNQASALVTGLGVNDKATIGTDEVKDVKVDGEGNVIAYEGDLIVTRTLMENETGRSYTITLNLGPVSLKINRANAGLFANKQTDEYNGEKHTVATSSYGVDPSVGVSANNFSVHYYVDGKEIDITKQSIINAGSYIYEVVFESSDNNYSNDSKRAQFVISPARINVKIDNPKQLVQEYIEGKTYTINYSIEDVKGIGIVKEDTELKFVRKGSPVSITKAGRYEFVIALKADKANEYGNNIVFSNNSGYLDLTVSEIVAYNSSEEEVARIQLKNAGDSILADTFTSRYVYATNAKSEDDLYYASVNQYMATISKTIGSDAKLAVVVKMGLTYGVNYQNLQGQDAIITVVLPETVDKSLKGYALYTTNASGGLEVLKQGDYTLNGDGTITYTSNYLGSLVIVSLAEEGLSPAAIGGIAGGSAALVLIIAGAVAVTIIKKKKMLKSL